MMGEMIYRFVFVTFLVEILVEVLKPLYRWLERILDFWKVELEVDIVVTQAIAIAFAFASKLDILEVSGIPLDSPVVGYIITGLLMSKGSNFMHDLFEKFNMQRLLGKFKR